MAELTYNEVFDGVSAALKAQYPSKDIFGKRIGQGLTPGAFNVIPISATSEAQLGSRQKKKITFDVIYYPQNDTNTEFSECLSVADALPFVLSTITTPNGNKLHSTVHESKNEDGVAHCIVSFSYFVYLNTKEQTELMYILDAEFMGTYNLHIGGYK